VPVGFNELFGFLHAADERLVVSLAETSEPVSLMTADRAIDLGGIVVIDDAALSGARRSAHPAVEPHRQEVSVPERSRLIRSELRRPRASTMKPRRGIAQTPEASPIRRATPSFGCQRGTTSTAARCRPTSLSATLRTEESLPGPAPPEILQDQ